MSFKTHVIFWVVFPENTQKPCQNPILSYANALLGAWTLLQIRPRTARTTARSKKFLSQSSQRNKEEYPHAEAQSTQREEINHRVTRLRTEGSLKENPHISPLNCRYVYGKIFPMSQRTAHFNQKMNIPSLKLPKAILSSDLGNRQLYSSSK